MYQCDYCSTGYDEWRTNCINCGATLKKVREIGLPHESFDAVLFAWPDYEQPNRDVRPLPPPLPGHAIRSGGKPHFGYVDWPFVLLYSLLAAVAIVIIMAYFGVGGL